MQPQKSTDSDGAIALTPEQGLPVPEQVSTRASIARSSALIGSGTMLSRVLGLVRDMVIAFLFPKPVSDAFFVAFRLPNMLREMLAEGAMNAGFIPVFSQYMTTRTREEAQELCAVVLGAVTALLLVISALGVLFAPAIVRLITLEFGPASDDLLLAIRLSRVLFPYILLIGVASLLMAILNSLHRFFSSSYAPMLLNLSMIVSAYYFRNYFREPVFAMAVGVLIGGMLQILLQIPFMLKTGIPLRFSWNLRHPGLRRILTLLTPTFFGQAVREVNVIADTMLGWYLGVGMVSALYYAYRLIHLPLAVFGLSVATAILPTMSRAASLGEIDNLKRTLSLGLRSVLFIMLPATVGLIVLRAPIIRLLFERGKFGPEATSATAFALLGYSFGLFAYAGAKVLAFAFYSMKNTRLPVTVAAIAMVLNIILNLLLMIPLKQGGLALASSISAMINMTLLWILLKKRIGAFGGRAMMEPVVKICALSLAMGVLVYVLAIMSGSFARSATTFGRLVGVIIPMTGGMIFYLGSAFGLQLEEAAQLRKIWRRRSRAA